jgi:hypothetical protein
MSRPSKIKRNEPCPCFSGEKFKNCCSGKVDWEAVKEKNLDCRRYLSVRGRNLYFVERMAEALQLDALGQAPSSKAYKAAFTADAVQKIHEAVLNIWPPDIDLAEALKGRSPDVSGLYIGDYDFPYVTRAIVRHSIYANRILLIDPFIYPASVRDEFNPIVNPAQYRTQTLKNANLWFALVPWIKAGIVAFIRPPSDFDRRLNWDVMKAQEKKFQENTELKKATEESLDDLSVRHSKKLMYEQLVLSAPDSYLKQKFTELGLGAKGTSVEDFLKSIQEDRERSPDFLEPLAPNSTGQLSVITTGASYPIAAMTAGMTGSYLFTDLHVRWREIEIDRESHSAENKSWAPFAKALQNTPLKYLNALRLEHALTLREEGRLESLRRFLARVWKDASAENEFDSANAILLAEELTGRIRDAEQEWKKIDEDLLKIVGQTALAGLLAAGPLIAGGHAWFLAAAAAVGGGVPVVGSTLKRRSFQDRFPAAFFMKIENNELE